MSKWCKCKWAIDDTSLTKSTSPDMHRSVKLDRHSIWHMLESPFGIYRTNWVLITNPVGNEVFTVPVQSCTRRRGVIMPHTQTHEHAHACVSANAMRPSWGSNTQPGVIEPSIMCTEVASVFVINDIIVQSFHVREFKIGRCLVLRASPTRASSLLWEDYTARRYWNLWRKDEHTSTFDNVVDTVMTTFFSCCSFSQTHCRFVLSCSRDTTIKSSVWTTSMRQPIPCFVGTEATEQTVLVVDLAYLTVA